MTVEIAPDTKDWTWVLDRPCPECGLDARTVQPYQVPWLIRENAAAWQPVLTAADARVRPRPDVWSALEYGCHVRDVFRLFRVRLGLMLQEHDPLFPNWDQDETAVAERYGEQDPPYVAAELLEAADRLARDFASLEDPQWRRVGRRTDGACFTVVSFSRYLVHDPIHHLHDVTG